MVVAFTQRSPHLLCGTTEMGKRVVKSAVGEEEDSEHGLLATVVSKVSDSLNIEGLSARVGEVLADNIAGLVSEQGLAEEILAEHGEKLASQLKREVIARMLRSDS